MVVTKNFQFPSDEELNIQELSITWPYIRTAAAFIGKKCEWFNNEFMLCRQELKDPRKCMKEGREVTNCAINLMLDIRNHCRNEFEAHMKCAYDLCGEHNDGRCSDTQQLLDDCMLKKLNLERPPDGYFCEARVHNTSRPKPEKKKREYPDRVPDSVPPPYPPPRYMGSEGFAN
ncbi:NADH dehydrogenase [ubiquinone] 1 alpha subcomplex subunit 8 [Eufriesea mexicana]|uniref:NADH dehydrogenase [ubiquinone] 1 alpha subcomplex subunit 8 n=1 Tax=Eufriesea mexicana TaxID=516756 RepID=A0A310S5K4_9HYME|nr:PREDICTED: NADH dehydrogenase [ubiquinone] 1 alpha subcomplex subunit 8 [Eufriesea mexicana]OAD52834.1 NADH dehydrogenase [ubiquinone] 1 alpha subcomplex subunit 8 [Eufriesea mexicana]